MNKRNTYRRPWRSRRGTATEPWLAAGGGVGLGFARDAEREQAADIKREEWTPDLPERAVGRRVRRRRRGETTGGGVRGGRGGKRTRGMDGEGGREGDI